MTTPHIIATDLRLGWEEELVLQEASFTVAHQSCFAILGVSGCGKTTLLRHLIGLERPQAGSIRIDGLGDPAAASGRPTFGVLFQGGALFGSQTLAENCALPLKVWTDLPDTMIRELVQAKLDLVDLGGYADHRPDAVSGGMRKRAAIARALILEPRLLFLDEPSAGLDPVTAAGLDELVRVLVDDLRLTVVAVTHELASIERIADDCIMLDKQQHRIIARGDPRVLRTDHPDPVVQAFFHRQARSARPGGMP